MHRNTSKAWISTAAALTALLLTIGCQRPPTTELGKQTIDRDTTWSGEVVVGGDIYVPPGVTLTIAPGTRIKFRKIDESSDQNLFLTDSPYYPEAELIIRGKLIARGTPAEQIIFTSAELTPRAADWGAINFLGSDGNVIEHAKILCAYNGIHAHGGSVRVAHTEFARNGVGISFKKEEETPDAPWFGKGSHLVITRCTFSNNKGGIGFRNSSAEITHNEIRDNKFFGIWPKEDCEVLIRNNEITNNKKGIYLYQARGLTLTHNNIYDNRDYDLSVAEAQDFPVEARHNWFGTVDQEQIDQMIFDRQDDPELAEIIYRPFLEQPAAWRADD